MKRAVENQDAMVDGRSRRGNSVAAAIAAFSRGHFIWTILFIVLGGKSRWHNRDAMVDGRSSAAAIFSGPFLV